MDFRLPWRELDPRRREAPDLEAVRKQAGDALRRKPGRTSGGREQAQRELRFLVWSELGAWCEGWHDPVGAGGASRVWTGAESVGDDDAETVEKVAAAVDDWQAWLVTLSEAFDEVAESTRDLDEVDAVARGAATVLPLVLERTGAEGDWARTFAAATSWCVQACGRADEDLTERVRGVTKGRLEVGAAPAPDAASEVVDEVALEVAVREKPPFTEDALEAWWTLRATAPWDAPPPLDVRPAEGDAHRAYIRRVDRPRSTVRADAMTRALVRARYGAKKRLKLDLPLMKEWLELALASSDFAVRKNVALSKDEGERYGRPKDLDKRLAQALSDATAEGVGTLSRAARLYLDLSYLQPFTDGNARLARLALDYVLTRDNLGMHDATPIFGIRRWAHDVKEPWRLQRVLGACTGPG